MDRDIIDNRLVSAWAEPYGHGASMVQDAHFAIDLQAIEAEVHKSWEDMSSPPSKKTLNLTVRKQPSKVRDRFDG